MNEEAKVTRSVAEIQQEYQGLCTRAGHIQYQLHIFKKDLDLVNEQLQALNFEAAASARAEQEAKDKAASDAATEVKAEVVS